jgi:hypothetical protein
MKPVNSKLASGVVVLFLCNIVILVDILFHKNIFSENYIFVLSIVIAIIAFIITRNSDKNYSYDNNNDFLFTLIAIVEGILFMILLFLKMNLR